MEFDALLRRSLGLRYRVAKTVLFPMGPVINSNSKGYQPHKDVSGRCHSGYTSSAARLGALRAVELSRSDARHRQHLRL